MIILVEQKDQKKPTNIKKAEKESPKIDRYYSKRTQWVDAIQ